MSRGITPYYLAGDVETDTATGKATSFHFYGEASSRHNHSIKTIDRLFVSQVEAIAFIDELSKTHRFTLVFFNASYDFIYFNSLIEGKQIWKGTRLITARLKRGIQIIDVTNILTKGKLKDWIEWEQMEQRFSIKKYSLSNILERGQDDARATWHLIMKIQQFCDEEGISMRLTAGSLALSLFERKYTTENWVQRPRWIDDFEKDAYYGGVVLPGHVGIYEVDQYDINSTYTAIEAEENLPNPNTATLIRRPDMKSFNFYLNSSFDFVATCGGIMPVMPEIKYPPLPVRTKERTIYPAGNLSGSWTSVDLRYAISLGFEVTRVTRIMVYRESKPYFREFATYFWNKRIDAVKRGHLGDKELFKLMPNSLYGKFAEYRGGGVDLVDVTGHPEMLIENTFVFDHPDGHTYAPIPNGEKVKTAHTFVCIAAFITAHARVRLFKAIHSDPENFVYGDTDSTRFIIGHHANIIIGSGLGEWKDEGRGIIRVISPKNYVNNLKRKIKGVPDRAVELELIGTPLWDGKECIPTFWWLAPIRTRTSIRSGTMQNVWKIQTKKIRGEIQSRQVLPDGTTLPLII